MVYWSLGIRTGDGMVALGYIPPLLVSEMKI